jgi:hypothetical protein
MIHQLGFLENVNVVFKSLYQNICCGSSSALIYFGLVYGFIGGEFCKFRGWIFSANWNAKTSLEQTNLWLKKAEKILKKEEYVLESNGLHWQILKVCASQATAYKSEIDVKMIDQSKCSYRDAYPFMQQK